MDLKTKIIIGLSVACIILGSICGMYYNKWKLASTMQISLSGELFQAKETIVQLKHDVANVPKEKIKTVIKIVPEYINVVKVDTKTIGNTVYITTTITQSLKDTEIILIIKEDGTVVSNQQNVTVIHNEKEFGFVCSNALSVVYSPAIGVQPAYSFRFFRLWPVYVGVSVNHKMLGADVSWKFYKNVSAGIGYGEMLNNVQANQINFVPSIYVLGSVSF